MFLSFFEFIVLVEWNVGGLGVGGGGCFSGGGGRDGCVVGGFLFFFFFIFCGLVLNYASNTRHPQA